MKKVLKIANSQAFWGDQPDASSKLLSQQPDLDFLTLDYLSEVSLSIMASQRAKDPSAGYAKDFLEVVKSLIPFWEQGSQVKIVTNAGGLDPKKCAEACLSVLKDCKNRSLSVAVVYGDDVLELIKANPDNLSFHHLETGDSIVSVIDRLTTANAYLGAKPITEALLLNADIVVTGRIADPSLTVGPCVYHFGWGWEDYDKIAQATVAGHLIECGTQVTGGIATDWLSIADPANLGFPFVEVDETGKFIITKPEKTSGSVNLAHVKEQLLYEIGDPSAYLSPDVTVSFLSLALEQVEANRVLVSGAKGRVPSPSYKVSATYRDGYRAEGTLAIFGRQCREKARRSGEIILERMQQAGYVPKRSLIECIGAGDVVPGIQGFQNEAKEGLECLLRISVADSRIEVLEYFSKQIAPLVTCGPQGTTGYISGRPHIRSVFGYWPCLIERAQITPKMELLTGDS
jgi:hypothetical protein